MLVGATMAKGNIAYWEPKLVGNNIVRVFPNPSDGIPAAASDPRYAYCKRVGAIPFISGKCNGDAAKLGSAADARTKRTFRNVVMDLIDAGFPMVYCTDHHEPEGDAKANFTASIFISNFNALLAVINGLPPAYRAKVKCGPVMTKQWTENDSSRSYSTWDPGTGDFYGVDCYLNSWAPGTSDQPFIAYPAAAGWLSAIKSYRKTPTDTRPRILVEFGAVQPPWDSDGSARAAWYKAVFAQLATWTPSTTAGWVFLGVIVWNEEGTGGSSIQTLGTRRWFNLDRIHNSKPYTYTVTASDGTTKQVTDPIGNYDTLPPVAKPVQAYNSIFQTYAAGGTGGGGTTQLVTPSSTLGVSRVGTPAIYNGTTPPAPVVVPPVVQVNEPPPALSSVGAFTILVTDSSFKPVAPPIVWQNMDLELKRNDAGSGIVQLRPNTPAAVAGINASNSRLCVIRNPMASAGIAGGVLMSGPIEKPGAYRWSVDDEAAGSLKVAFASNEVYLHERLTLPDPTAAVNAQTVSAYVLSNVIAETALRQLVNVNGGPGSLAARRIPGLALGALSGAAAAGTAVTYSTRLEALDDVLRVIALAGGDLTWRVRDTGAGALLFEVYPGVLRNGAVFSRQRGNLRAIETDPEAPTGTVAIVGGSGSGASRVLYEYAPVTEWRRMETFVNQSNTGTVAELLTAAGAALADKGYRAGLSTTAADPFGGGYGIRYRLGDLVPVEDAGGVVRTDRVTSVRIKVDAGGPITYEPTIGGGNTPSDPATIRLLRELLRRVAKTERS